MSYVQLTLYERFAIYQFHVAQFGVREIARRLNRHHSTISRELKRNRATLPGARYDITFAHDQTLTRRQRARRHRRVSDANMRLAVHDSIKEALNKSCVSDRGDLGLGQEGEDAV